MSPNSLQNGAILVADSHYAPWNTSFFDFLSALERKEIETTQLILMGDNFDLLFGPVSQTLRLNSEAIDVLNRLSLRIGIVYLEGNHDFRLSSIFPNIHVIGREKQPWIVQHAQQRIAFLHGDLEVRLGYSFYTVLIRNRFILAILNFMNERSGGMIINRLIEAMKRKKHCMHIPNFETIAARHCGKIKGIDVLIEGHYHQNCSFSFDALQYHNLGAFACKNRYYTLKLSENELHLDEQFYSRAHS